MSLSTVKYSRIIDLNKQHWHISMLFNMHQKRLMHGDNTRAFDILKELKNYITSHMKAENDYLFPLYKKYVSSIPTGGAVEYFINEHHKINRFMEEFTGKFSRLKKSEIDMVKLFDIHYRFKHLLDHHHSREDTFLFRLLDKVLDKKDKNEVLQRFSFKQS